ncbi:MAG: tetratricopeptide repeat protein, partial [Cyclobacteriaceae bacterium]
ALSIVPLEPYFLNNRGFLFLEIDSLTAAEKDINRSIILDPSNAWAYRNKGLLYAKRDQHKDAVRLFNEAISRNKFIDEVYTPLGRSLYHLNQLEEACEAWKKGISLEEQQASILSEKYCG